MNLSSTASATVLSQATSSNASKTETGRKATLSQDDFLNLFFTQMKYQNPLEPMDNNQMANQMAQMNMVEALTNMNQVLNTISTNQTSLNNLSAPALIGKTVEAQGNRLSIQEGKVLEGAYQLSQPGEVLIQIFDSNGNLVRNIQPGAKDTSKQKIKWDGKDQNGTTLPDGTYFFQVSAVNAKGQAVSATTYRVGTIGGVSYENGIAYFDLSGEKITLSKITAFVA
jgi:flagellar basal-body rod modification protein FlgD